MSKNNLLSIGEIAKIAGVTTKAMLYYEKIGILIPVSVSLNSGYRYYSFDQVYIVEIIKLCIELNVPLKELKRFFENNETVHYSALLSYGREIISKKLEYLQKGLEFISSIEQKISNMEKYCNIKKSYKREIPEKFFYIVPYKPSKNVSPMEMLMTSTELKFYEADHGYTLYSELLEYGIIHEHTAGGINSYIFTELPEQSDNNKVKCIPAGVYCCIQNEFSMIDNVTEIFSEYLKNNKSFLAIETEILTEIYRISKPMHELRVTVI